MGFGAIAAGLLFLFNPNISVVDVLPDAIGYLLIYRGLFQMSFISPKLQEVRSSIWKLALITALRFLSIVFLPYTSETFGLVLVFTFGVLEAVFFIPAFVGLFEGFYGLGVRLNVDSVFDSRTISVKTKDGEAKTKKVEYAERLKIYTIVFFLIKTTASILPELTALQANDSGSIINTRLNVRLSQFKPLFYLFCTAIVLVFGLVWLVRFLRYVNRMKRDTVLCSGVTEYFQTNVASSPAQMAALRMKIVHILLAAAAVSTLIFLVDGVDVILNAFASVFVIIALILMCRDAENKPLVAGSIAVSVASAILSVVSLLIQIPYFEEYEAMAARYIANASVEYRAVRFWGTAENVVVMIMFILAFLVYCCVLKKHVSYINITGNVTQYSADARRSEILHEVYGRVIVTCIIGVIYFVLSAAYFTVAMYFAEIYLVNTVVCFLWIGMVIHLITTAYENIYERLEQNY